MSKKINIMVEVDDRVYDLVVAPHKRNKSFSKLITTLLSGYTENSYIRGFADDTLSDLRRESANALDSIIGDMHESLANMGMFSDEIKSTAESGMGIFGNRQGAEPTSSSDVVKEQVEKETKELREDVSSLKSQNEQILALLTRMVASSPMQMMQGMMTPQMPMGYTMGVQQPMQFVTQPQVQTPDPTISPITPTVESTPKQEYKEEVKEEFVAPVVTNVPTDSEEDNTSDGESGDDEAAAAMALLLTGNTYSF